MSTPPRIDELRRKFDENPRRYFAPLANEYRKAGDLAQAIGLCREFLPKQPGHMSGHIVFGQALYEAGELGEARTVFESALALDPENLIALRHLGDIAKTKGDAAGARRWYERVLDADPRNDDIAAQLATLGTGNTPVSVPAFGEASLNAGRGFGSDPSSPGSLTPAYGVGIGMDVLPTPDSSMRAVDFDEVNARISGQTPLFTPAHPEQPSAAAVTGESPAARFEPLDLDAMEAAYEPVVDDVVDESADHAVDHAVDHAGDQPDQLVEHSAEYPAERIEPDAPRQDIAAASVPVLVLDDEVAQAPEHQNGVASGEPHLDRVASDDPFTESSARRESARVDVFGTLDDGDDEMFEPDAASMDEPTDDEFDEYQDGLLVPEWPDATDIIAQIGTPRSATPVAPVSAQAAYAAQTPPYGAPAQPPAGQATLDAIAAFGRERDEPAEGEPPRDDGLPAQQLAMQDVASPDSASVELASPDDAAPNDAHRDDAADGTEFAVASTALAGDVDRFGEFEDEFEAEFNESAAASSEGDLATEAMEWEPEDVPAARVVEVGGEAGAADETDEAEYADDVHEEAEAAAELQTSSSFVTETMGELLVSQGFVVRAVGVYEELVRRRPYDPVLTSRLAELHDMMSAESAHLSRATSPHDTPFRNTPPLVRPYATPESVGAAASGDDGRSTVTSRELFARLAARRVPRRTPSQFTPAVKEPDEGLASLFGGPATVHDDMAARALADAFAPVPAGEMATGTALDFAIERPALAPTPLSTPAVAPPQNAGFSFDRFFPDRALQQPNSVTPLAGSSAESPAARSTSTITPQGGATPAPATEDLAQFSAWLKGLSKP